MLDRPSDLHPDELRTKCNGSPACDQVLHGEKISRIAVEPLRPQMRIGLGIDQLGVDADLIAGSPYAAFEHITHTKLAADLLGVDLLALIRERGVTRDDEHALDARQISR